MHYRQLGRSGLRISAFTLGTMTFGGKGDFAKTGNTDLAGASRQIDLCIEAGINMFDTADIYSTGVSEEILGAALKGRGDDIMVTTKARFRMGKGRMTPVCRAITSSARARPASGVWAAIISTCITCMNGMARPRWRKRSKPSTP